MLFRDIPSNTRAKQQLLKAIHNDRLSHAHLFLGNDGSSSLAMAWAFAQYLMCAKPTEEDSCGQCPSCLKSAKLSHPDLHWVFPVITGRGTHPTSDMFLADWRDFLMNNLFPSEEDWYSHLGTTNKQGFISVNEANELNKKTILKPYEGSYRVVIIWHSEKMHGPTANKLLKLLEEPPQKTIFILLTSQSENLLATIVSRLQSIKIEPTDEHNKLAERRVRLGLLLAELGQKAEVEVTEADMTQAIMEQAKQYPGQERQFFELIQKNEQMQQQIRAPLFEDKVVDYVFENASVTEKEVTKNALQKAVEALEEE